MTIKIGALIGSISIYTDGASRGNPGISASGFNVFDGRKFLHGHFEYNGITTNNYAEYRAVLLSLTWCSTNLDNPSELTIELYSDSELVVRQLNMQYKTKSKPLIILAREVNKISKRFKTVRFSNLPRGNKNISAVDRELNILLDNI